MRIRLVAFLLIVLSTISVFAQNLTVSGYVIDKKTEETLIGANVMVVGTTRGAATDRNGFFRITG
ncbi:MAG: carboxypeptidase-like regulatory domain-containing protein, partial [bacterium]